MNLVSQNIKLNQYLNQNLNPVLNQNLKPSLNNFNINKKTNMNILNTDIKNNILSGKKFTVGIGNISSIHRSPRGNDCWYCEHQYNVEYSISRIDGNFIYFNVPVSENMRNLYNVKYIEIQHNNITEYYVESKWKINMNNGTLHVYATHSFEDKWEIYKPNEYSLNIKILKL